MTSDDEILRLQLRKFGSSPRKGKVDLCMTYGFKVIIYLTLLYFLFAILRDHPFKMSALFSGGGVKYLPNLPTDRSKKLQTVGG